MLACDHDQGRRQDFHRGISKWAHAKCARKISQNHTHFMTMPTNYSTSDDLQTGCGIKRSKNYPNAAVL